MLNFVFIRKILERKNKIILVATTGSVLLLSATPVFADEPISVDYAALFTGVYTEAVRGLTATIPIFVPILGVMTAIGLGMKVYKHFTGTR